MAAFSYRAYERDCPHTLAIATGAAHESSSPACDFCSDRHCAFILASDRSGSTAVLYMAKEIPVIYVAGENGGLLGRLRDVCRLLANPYG